MTLKPDGCTWSTTSDADSDIVIDGTNVPYCSKEVGLRLLRCSVLFTARTNAAVDENFNKLWAAYHAQYRLWAATRQNIPTPLLKKMRLRFLEKLATDNLYWGAESWTPTADDLRRLKATQLKMYRRVLQLEPQEGESRQGYHTRTAYEARTWMADIKATAWDDQLLLTNHRWGGHIARSHPSRWIRRTTEWRNAAFRELTKAKNHGELHTGHRYRYWRWEADIAAWAPH